MPVQQLKKNHFNLILRLVLVAGILGLAGTAIAQGDEETVFLPLVLKDNAIRPLETIMILTPASGSRVTSPIRIAGEADPTFEQNLVVRLLRADGTLVTQEPTTIQADIGQRGPFELELPVSLSSEQNIFIQVFSDSPRDGGITHLSSVVVTFSPSGPDDIIARDPYSEQISILQPEPGDTLSGGMVQVSGFGLASFEQTLLVELQDENGDVLASEPVTLDAPDLGQPGNFETDIEFAVSQAQNGRIVVRDVSPAFGGDTHLSSVEVNLAP